MTEATARYEPARFDPTTPNVARMYDYYLGGKDHFAADREAAEMALKVAPELREGAREVRRFLGRAVRYLTAEAGIRQFIDIGCGLPTQGNVHEIAQSIAPDARVAYVDNDPQVVAHARALLENNPLTAAVRADMRNPEEILDDPALGQLIDLSEPVAVLLIAVLHVVPDDDLALRIVARLREAMVPGSYLVVSEAVSDLKPEITARLAKLYQDRVQIGGPRKMNLRARADVERYFAGLELVEPGVEYLPSWRPAGADPGAGDTWAVGGVGLKKI